MAYIIDGEPTTVHISFAPEEISMLDRKSDELGMPRTAYIRKMALDGKAKGYNLKPIVEHTMAIGSIADDVRSILSAPHPDRFSYEADIERTEKIVAEILETEKKLLKTMTRRIKRGGG